MTQEEIYASIKGFENYQVSNLGNVKNIKTNRILKQVLRGDYLSVVLCESGKKYTKNVHKLMAEAFLTNDDNKSCVDHIDNNKQNNNILNLRFATHTENSRNRSIAKNNSSSVKGVDFFKRLNKWRARIMIDGISIHLGFYETLEDAKQARIKKVNEVFGEFTNECELN